MDRHAIAAGGISAEITAQGAELCVLRDGDGHDYLWPATPPWPRHAPVLFPIVGRLAGDTLRHDGRDYTLGQHGFARDRRFDWVERTRTGCRLELRDDAATRASYPFAFRFEIAYAVADSALTMRFRIDNPAGQPLPVSMGAHPAFRWPLRAGVAKAAHSLIFAADEPAPVRRLSGGLLQPDPVPSPIEGRVLRLDESLFAADALILDHPASRAVRFAAPGGPALDIAWSGFPELGIWSRAGGDFLCIEPWCGMADPVGFMGDFIDKPGLLHIPPGATATAELRISLDA